jgi:hypothetical protein
LSAASGEAVKIGRLACPEGGATMRTIRSLAHGDALVALEAVTVALKAADEAAVIAIADQQGNLSLWSASMAPRIHLS